MDIKKLIKSFKFAGEGLVSVFKEEQNFRIEVLVALVVIISMVCLPLSGIEIAVLSLAISSVLVMEILNTVLERLLDMNIKGKNKKIKFLKDIMAGAVLLNVLVAVVVGSIIFWQYLFQN